MKQQGGGEGWGTTGTTKHKVKLDLNSGKPNLQYLPSTIQFPLKKTAPCLIVYRHLKPSRVQVYIYDKVGSARMVFRGKSKNPGVTDDLSIKLGLSTTELWKTIDLWEHGYSTIMNSSAGFDICQNYQICQNRYQESFGVSLKFGNFDKIWPIFRIAAFVKIDGNILPLFSLSAFLDIFDIFMNRARRKRNGGLCKLQSSGQCLAFEHTIFTSSVNQWNNPSTHKERNFI